VEEGVEGGVKNALEDSGKNGMEDSVEGRWMIA